MVHVAYAARESYGFYGFKLFISIYPAPSKISYFCNIHFILYIVLLTVISFLNFVKNKFLKSLCTTIFNSHLTNFISGKAWITVKNDDKDKDDEDRHDNEDEYGRIT